MISCDAHRCSAEWCKYGVVVIGANAQIALHNTCAWEGATLRRGTVLLLEGGEGSVPHKDMNCGVGKRSPIRIQGILSIKLFGPSAFPAKLCMT